MQRICTLAFPPAFFFGAKWDKINTKIWFFSQIETQFHLQGSAFFIFQGIELVYLETSFFRSIRKMPINKLSITKTNEKAKHRFNKYIREIQDTWTVFVT